MKKRLVFPKLFAIILMGGLLLSGCGSTKTATTPTSTSTSTSSSNSPSTPTKVIELKFSDWGPSTANIGLVHSQAAKKIEEGTNGRVKVTPYFSQSLLKAVDTYNGVASGVADIALYQIDMTPGVQSLNRIFNLPFTADAPSFLSITKIYQELLKKFPELDQENEKKGTKCLAIRAMAGYNINTVNKEVRVPADLKGMKINIAGDPTEVIPMLKNAGASSITMSPGDTYSSLQKGLIEGHIFHFPAIDVFKTVELLKNHTLIGKSGLMTGAHVYMINLKTWDSLTPDDQKVIQETYQWVIDEMSKYDAQYEMEVRKKVESMGHKIIQLTPEEDQKWYDLAKPEIEKWKETTEAKGWPAKKVYDEYQRLMKEAMIK